MVCDSKLCQSFYIWILLNQTPPLQVRHDLQPLLLLPRHLVQLYHVASLRKALRNEAGVLVSSYRSRSAATPTEPIVRELKTALRLLDVRQPLIVPLEVRLPLSAARVLLVSLQALVNADHPPSGVHEAAVLLEYVAHHVVVDAHSPHYCRLHLGVIHILGENEVVGAAVVALLLQILHVVEEVVLV